MVRIKTGKYKLPGAHSHLRILLRTFWLTGAAVAALLSFRPLAAYENAPADARGEGGRLLEEIVTTATKKSDAQAAQDVPIAMSVLDSEALYARQTTDIEDLSYALPNVALDGIGTGKGIANFSIRGLGVAGSIPSIDPTVGMFVDGVYLGVNYGVISDLLDVETVEVLRGPQGLLFGRNVTGGAVLIRSRRPGDTFSGNAAARIETGLDRRVSASLEGPLAGAGISSRVSVQYREDDGWFSNGAPGGGAVGAERTWVVRPVLAWMPSDSLDITLIYERGDTDSDGPASQNRFRFGGFDFAIDEPGYSRIEWAHAILEANRKITAGNGKITNLFGWRKVQHDSLADIDSTATPIFHLFAFTDQRQISNELRYSGWMRDRWELTVGGYYFKQNIRYRESRILRGARGSPFGGEQDHQTAGIFMHNDIRISSDWILTLGARYTLEEKDVEVATAGLNAACPDENPLCDFDFRDGDSWRNVTPRIGLQRWIGPNVQIYGHYTKGFRSGGYNLRNTSPTASPGPFDEERQDSFEAGLKSELAEGRARLNLAAFRNRVYGLQRQVTRADAATGGIQVTANTADATIQGIEVEATAIIKDALTVNAFLGYTHGEYDRVRHDLNGDGTTAGDENLPLPRLAELTYGADASYERPIGSQGLLSLRASFAHRDDSYISDDNRGVLDSGDLLDASVAFSPRDGYTITLYGRNLLNDVLRRSDLALTGLVDSTYSPLKEGRVVGIALRSQF